MTTTVSTVTHPQTTGMNQAGLYTHSVEDSESASLAKGIIRSQQIPPGETMRVQVIEGTAWITMEGDPEDYVVNTGEVITFPGPGLLVIEGLSNRTLLEVRL